MSEIEIIASILSYFPVIGLAALGGLLSQKSGVYNISIEGFMAFGTMSGLLGYYYTGSLWVGLLAGFIFVMAFGVLLAFLTVSLKLDQIVIGFTLWFFAEGLAGFLYPLLIPGGFKVPERFGGVLGFNIIFFLTIAIFVLAFVIFRWTRPGLAVRVSGESPGVADISGINVQKTRWITVVLGSGLMGISGAYLALHILQGFNYMMVAGYGWVAFAVILFGRWSALGVMGGSLFFSALIGIQTRLQVAGVTFIPSEFMVVLPHIAVIIVLSIVGIFGKKSGMPSALGVPYNRE